MTNKHSLTSNQMATRILQREDNPYKKENVYSVVKFLYEEIGKALMNGERVQITGVGTLIPELKTHIGTYNIPRCNQCEGNPPPYVKVKVSRNKAFREKLNEKLLDNLENGIAGLGETSFSAQQIKILKDSGFINNEEED